MKADNDPGHHTGLNPDAQQPPAMRVRLGSGSVVGVTAPVGSGPERASIGAGSRAGLSVLPSTGLSGRCERSAGESLSPSVPPGRGLATDRAGRVVGVKRRAGGPASDRQPDFVIDG